MPPAWVVPLISALASLVLAGLVCRRKPQTELVQTFAFLCVMLVSWNLIFFVLYSVTDKHLALEITRPLRVGSFFMPPAILHLHLALQPRRSRFWRLALASDYMIATGFILVNAADLYITDLERFAWGYHSVATPYYGWYGVFTVANFAATLLVIGHTYRASSDARMRLQLKFWLLGALVALPLGVTNLFPVYGLPAYPLGNLGNAVWAAIVAYAIVRHRLMDMDLVITKGLTYVAVSIAVIIPAFILTLWLERVAFGSIHAGMSAAVLILFMVVGMVFPALRGRAESRIERSLFPRRHGHRAALTAFTRSIVRILDRERILREIGTTLSDTLDIGSVAVALGGEQEPLAIRDSIGCVLEQREFPRDGEFVRSLTRHSQGMLCSELEMSADPEERSTVADTLRRNGWELCIPLTVGGRLTGFIGLGRKANLRAFYAEDLDLLETLAAETAVALENARLYEELKKSQDIIRRADRLSALGTLAAGIAHEVRNPLVSIQTFFQLAPDRLHDEEFLTSFLGMTANEVKRISDLITELLSFARSPARMLRDVDINDVVERVATLLEPEAKKHKVAFTRALASNIPFVFGDPDQVKQVLINVVLNAFQATPPGGAVSVTSRTVEHRGVRFGQLEIRDTGTGIPPDKLNDIFNPFFTTKDKGTGLGLSIAHQIVVEHGGLISVESTEGHGTSFTIDLPASDQSGTAAQFEHGEVAYPGRYARARKVAP